MRLKFLGAVPVIGLLFFGAAFAQTKSQSFTDRKQNWASCQKNGSAEFKTDTIDVSIDSCTAIIESGRENTMNTALAYYSRGLLYQFKNDFDHALADYNQSISLDPLRVVAFINRGAVYYDRHDYDRAIADYSQSINIVANNAVAFLARAHAYEAKKDYDHAMADYGQAIRLVPTYAIAFFERGVCRFELGQMTDAESDFAQAVKLDPKNLHLALWLYLAHAKLGRTDQPEWSTETANLDLSKWPGPIVKLYLGQATPDQVMTALPPIDSTEAAEQACEASFYIGEYRGLHGDQAAAKLLLERAAHLCSQGRFRIPFAVAAELKRLQ